MFGSTFRKIIVEDSQLKLSSLRYLPRWMVFLIDICILFLTLGASYYLVFSLVENIPNFLPLPLRFIIVIGINAFMMFIFKTYAGIIRYSTFIDIQKLFASSFSTLLILLALKYIVLWGFEVRIFFTPLLFLYFILSFTILLVFRMIVKQMYHFIIHFNNSAYKKKILVLGISNHSVAVASALLENDNLPYYMSGFLTSRNDSKHAKLLGKPIITQDNLVHFSKEELGIDGVLLQKELLSKDELNHWVNMCLERKLDVYQLPVIEEFSETKIETNIRNLQIEDLLNRDPISIQNEEVEKRHQGKSVLITGGAGSIGSEIVRKVAEYNPSLIVILDQAETPMHDLELELLNKYPKVNFKFILGSVTNFEKLKGLFEKYHFSMVYHAAAYKHVPMIEKNPQEAVLVNILGTKYLANLSSQFRVNRFIMISTDKAVNPTNVMGASKRVAELFIQSLQDCPENNTKFITTRFGNVLGSNGSVIPLFKKQIEKGGPITLTHPYIVRYFMTIPEACELVLQAGTMGKGGEIFVFDMGEPIKILDLAKKMIRLSGLELDKDIKIEFIGLRPGEKLYEELLSDNTKTLPTPHEKIMVSKDPHLNYNELSLMLKNLFELNHSNKTVDIVKVIKQIVPEFKSSNSIFETLD